jgi:hypothetical protein
MRLRLSGPQLSMGVHQGCAPLCVRDTSVKGGQVQPGSSSGSMRVHRFGMLRFSQATIFGRSTLSQGGFTGLCLGTLQTTPLSYRGGQGFTGLGQAAALLKGCLQEGCRSAVQAQSSCGRP